MLFLNINGPINAGKTTVSKIMAKQNTNALFIEVDELLSDDEQQKLKLSRQEGWTERKNRLWKILTECKADNCYHLVIFAYPINGKSYTLWSTLTDDKNKFINITLAPSLEICLSNRGQRNLSENEKERIIEMYQEGHQMRSYADLIICNDHQSPEQTADIIQAFIKKQDFEKYQ